MARKKDLSVLARLKEVSLLVDPAILEKVATTDEEWSVRLIAVRRIEDQVLLTQIASTDRDKFVCMAAVNRLRELTHAL